MSHYRVNEIFYSLKGEGVRAGIASVFVRFAGCNLQCRVEPGPKSPGGFDCDTDHESGQTMSAEDIVAECRRLGGVCRWVVLTGGEPMLQVDGVLIAALKQAGFLLAVETNGTREVSEEIDWITVSPKVAEHTIRCRHAHEVKYVRSLGQPIPDTMVVAQHKLISPAFAGGHVCPEALAWCIDLVKENPEWRLSLQQHKLWGIR
jgi:7-carboxy-7-deazaguanine synthase